MVAKKTKQKMLNFHRRVYVACVKLGDTDERAADKAKEVRTYVLNSFGIDLAEEK